MKEGYEELEEEVNRILNNEKILCVKVSHSEDSGFTDIKTERHLIKITSVGGHGGVGLNWYCIADS